MQHVQRGIAAAEVVHQHHEAPLPQRLHRRAHTAGILAAHRFGDLDLQRPARQLIALRQLAEALSHVHSEDIHAGDVDGYRYQRQALVQAAADPAADLLPDVLVQIRNEAILFQHWHKVRGRHHAPIRLPPAGQRFRAHDGAPGGAALRLQIEGDLPVFQRVLEFRENAVVLGGLVVHGVVKGTDALLEIPLRLLAGQGRLVKQIQYAGIAVGIADTKGGQEPDGHPIPHDDAVDLLIQRLDLYAGGGHQQAKVVVAHVASQAAVFLRVLLHAGADAGQHHIPRLAPIPLVEQLELLQVDHQQLPVRIAVRHQPRRSGVKIVAAQQTRQRIPLNAIAAPHPRDARLAILDVLDIVDVAVDQPIRQVVGRTAQRYLLHPAPVAVQIPDAELKVDQARRVRRRQPRHQAVRIQRVGVGLTVVGMNQVVYRVIVEAAKRPFHRRYVILSVDVVHELVSILAQIDAQHLVIG